MTAQFMQSQPPRVWLAPMSGATDAAFRTIALRLGAPAVVSEMVAGETFLAERRDVVRRATRHDADGDWIVQLAGRRPEDMARSAERLAEMGVDVIDINMGCPARQVTAGASGSALMKDPVLAKEIICATIDGAGSVPVSLKMRLGWDDALLTAPDIGVFAETAGVVMLTVHGRTRCQFYTGVADWHRIRDTVDAVGLPVIANGDIVDIATARDALAQSGAYGVMIGRAAMGRPWLVADIAAELANERPVARSLADRLTSLCALVSESVRLYGEPLGVRMVRKHIAGAIDAEDGLGSSEARTRLRRRLCRLASSEDLLDALKAIADPPRLEVA